MKIILLIGMCFLIQFSANNANAQSIKFALVPKQTGIDFFDEIAKGCQDAAQKHSDVECIYKGPPTSDFRLQDRIVSELIDQGVAGIAISVINSEYLAANSLKKAKQYGIPVLTFDSDLSQETLQKHPNLRTAYVGTDNHALGQELARALLDIKSEGIYAIISGNRTAPNLHDRIVGFRDVLQHSKWKEFPRSPLYINDQPERAMKVLSFFLKTHANNPQDLDAIVGVSAALQAAPEQYKSALNISFQNKIRSDLKIISADTSNHQIDLITQGLSDVNVGQNTYQIGYKAINTLYLIYHEHDVNELNYTSLKICKRGSTPLCLLSGQEEKSELIN